jgi:aminopeptidase N
MFVAKVDRWQLVNDAWILALAGKASTTAALDISFSLAKETDYNVLSEVLSGLLRLGSFYKQEKWSSQYRARVHTLVAPLVRRLGFMPKSGDSENDTLLRPLVLLVAGTYGDEEVIARALKLFTGSVRKGTESIPADLRAVVYRLVAFVGGAPELQYFKTLYKQASQEEQNRLTRAMCSFPKPELVKKALEFSMTSAVRSQDAWRFVGAAMQEPANHSMVLQFVKNNWAWYMERYGSGGHALSRIVQAFAEVFEEKTYRQVREFFHKRSIPGAERTVQQVLEHIETHVLWHKRAKSEVLHFLQVEFLHHL